MKKNVFNIVMVLLLIIISLSGCVEHRYYRDNHQHSEGYYHRHHRTSAELDVHIHN